MKIKSRVYFQLFGGYLKFRCSADETRKRIWPAGWSDESWHVKNILDPSGNIWFLQTAIQIFNWHQLSLNQRTRKHSEGSGLPEPVVEMWPAAPKPVRNIRHIIPYADDTALTVAVSRGDEVACKQEVGVHQLHVTKTRPGSRTWTSWEDTWPGLVTRCDDGPAL